MNTNELTEEVSQLMSHMYDASIQNTMGGLGGCKHYEKQCFPARYQPYIETYITTERTACGCVVDYLFDNYYLNDNLFKR